MFRFVRIIKNIFFWKWNLLTVTCQDTIAVSAENNSSKKESKKHIIPYKPNLIADLESDHKNLLISYKRIMNSADKKQYAKLTLCLNGFSELLKSHLRKESIYLYMYLEFVIGKENGIMDSKIFRAFRLEMKNISVAVSGAINLYTNTPVTDETVDKFIKDFSEIGSILVDRIEREEKNLYPIYKK
jgi:hypothetical protein